MSATRVEVGTKVFTIEGPGAGPGFPSRTGEVVALETTVWGETAWVRFEDGTIEGCNAPGIRREVCGIGVYVEGSK
jgi:hypothetical protein